MACSPSASLIIIGGFAGTGKTVVSRRLATDLGIPRLGSDTIGRAIARSEGLRDLDVDSYWIAYDVLFRLCEEYVAAGVTTVLDITLGWEFQWREVDAIVRRHPATVLLPIVLRCPLDVCLERIRKRHAADPDHYDPPELYVTEPRLLSVWEYLDRLNRPEARYVDASGPVNTVYALAKAYAAEMGSLRSRPSTSR